MIEFISFFFPAFISIGIVYKSKEEKRSFQDFIINYSIYNVIINFTTLGSIYIYRYGQVTPLDATTFNASFTFKYLLISMLVAAILPILDKTVRQIINIKIEVKKYDGKKRK